MREIQDRRVLYLKGILFVMVGVLASGLLLWEHPSVRVAVLLALAVWGFARAYYFAFYVVEHYIDGGPRFSGLWAFALYLVRGPKSNDP